MSDIIITKEMLEKSIKENEDFIKMVALNKYGYENIKDVIEGVISYCNIEEDDQKELLRSGKFIPAGSILSACNKKEKGSFSNCYLTPIKSDSMDGIFECQKELANTFKMRGGSGFDITILRPKNTKVNNAAITSSGSVSFLSTFSEIGKVVGTNGRRAAMIATLDIRHPDALDFIKCKAWPEEVFHKDIFTNNLPDISSINISLKVTDSFFKAVENNEEWVFCFPDIEEDKELYDSYWSGDYDKWLEIGGKFKEYYRTPAKDILDLLSKASHKCGDPGIVFIDTVQRETFGTYIDESLKPVSTNPCSEQTLAYYNNCLLGSFVLHRYVTNEFTDVAKFDWDTFESDVKVATMLMNKFSDINENKHPLREQQEADVFGKRIGIEFTGLGDTFAMLGYTYGDINSIDFSAMLSNYALISSIDTSILLAKENGPCKALESRESREDFIDNCRFFEDGIADYFHDDILKYGMANTAFLTVGPCGSLSIVSDNCTSGIEPIFKFSYRRKNRIDNNEYEFIHYNACNHMLENFDIFEGMDLDTAKKSLGYVEADEISPSSRIEVQSAMQQYIDASISSTINLKSNCTQEEIKKIYKDAWVNGLKGITVFRDGCKDGVLLSTEDNKPTEIKEPTQSILIEKQLLPTEVAERHCVFWKKSKVYISVSLDNGEDPIEVFTKLPISAGYDKDGYFNNVLWMERTANWDSLCRLTSMLLRFGIPLEDVIDQLENASYSMVDAASILVRVLKRYIKHKEPEIDEETGEIVGGVCPECGEKSYVSEGGCKTCRSCGFSKCG